MAKFTVRITGTAPMWADVEVEAESAQEALLKVDNEMSDGGNGVDDWTSTGEVYDAEGNEVLGDEAEVVDG